METTTLHDVDAESIIHIPRPHQICGDMACDSRNKNHVIDLDGTLLGGTGGAIIPDSAADWYPIPGEPIGDANPEFGLGYYKVPNQLKTDLDGRLIPEIDLIKSRGT